VDGLVSGPFDLIVTHPKYMPESRLGVAAGKQNLTIELRPAFLVTFRVTTENRVAPETPNVLWTVPGSPPWTGVEALRDRGLEDLVPVNGDSVERSVDAVAGTFTYAPIRIPAGRPSATFAVKALGMEPWTSPPVDVPAEGGATTIDVPLRRDPNVGDAKISLETRDHQKLSFSAERCRVPTGGILRKDSRSGGTVVIQSDGDNVALKSVLAGPYRVTIISPLHAPAVVDVDVPPGGVGEAVATLGPPAKLRIKATAPEATVISVRLRQGNDILNPYPDIGQKPRAPDSADEPEQDMEAGDTQALSAGGEGVVVTGLPAGRVSLEVLSVEWTAPPTSVDLVEGETKEVELTVTKR
jgi:hypothetical protein